MTIEQLYEESIRGLPVGERIRLASLIMWESAGAGRLDFSEEWTRMTCASSARPGGN